MKTIKSLKDITTLEVDDKVVFGDLTYTVKLGIFGYYLTTKESCNDRIFKILNINIDKFIEALGISANYVGAFPETKSLEALTAIVSALFKEYEKQNELPKTWEEFCERNNVKEGESYIDALSLVIRLSTGERKATTDKNFCTSEKEAKAFLALMQLRQLRKAYVKDWEPDWMDSISTKYCIEVYKNEPIIILWNNNSHNLSFPTKELANQFLTNFKDLLEIAKPLL